LRRALAVLLFCTVLTLGYAASGNAWVSYDGKTLSVDFRDVDLAEALDAVSAETGVSFEIGPGVSGRLSKRFNALPLDRGLSRMLRDYSHVLMFEAADDTSKVTRVVLLPEGSQQTPFPPDQMQPELQQEEYWDPALEQEEYLDPELQQEEYLDPELQQEEYLDPEWQDDQTLEQEWQEEELLEGTPEELPLNANLLHQASGELLLHRHGSGHFVHEGRINGTAVQFLVDTGATTVAIPESLAHTLQLPRGPGRAVMTAAGTTPGYLTKLDRIEIGSLALQDVDAIVLPAMDAGGQALLGMSFLAEFELLQRRDTLIIRPPR
jgi:clan AA aspartic protease (TIGR02281 family)